MSRPTLREAIAGRAPIVGDGAMGTQLQRAGLEPGGCGDEWSLSHPDRVHAIHRSYVEAGAQVILTNTFGTNRFVLSRYELEAHAADIARESAAVALDAAGDGAWVLGDIGPCGGFLAPLGDVDVDDLAATWRSVMTALLTGGVHGLLIETMTALEELTLAVSIARALGTPLIVASMSFDPVRGGGVKTMMGVGPQAAARAAVEAGAHVVGANCGRCEPEEFALVGRLMREITDGPVMLQPNAGQPRLEGEAIVYPRGPDDLAPVLVALSREARIVGGCCGTTPAHIRAFSRALGRTEP